MPPARKPRRGEEYPAPRDVESHAGDDAASNDAVSWASGPWGDEAIRATPVASGTPAAGTLNTFRGSMQPWPVALLLTVLAFNIPGDWFRDTPEPLLCQSVQ